MGNVQKNYINLVAIGGQNPQILNLDFLKSNKILPVDEEPFRSILSQAKPQIEFVSVPGFVRLVVGNIEFIVNADRFQIKEAAISKWAETKIVKISEKYFEILRYTPLKIVGFNLNSTIIFDNTEMSQNFQNLFLPQNAPILKIINKGEIAAGVVLRYPYSAGGERFTIALEQQGKVDNKRTINFNYEFDFTDWPKFKSELVKVAEIEAYADSIIGQLMK